MYDASIVRTPIKSSSITEKSLVCPECGQELPIDSRTECDNCGAHIKLKVKIIAPGINDEEEKHE